MEDELISFETAKLAQDKGFNVWCKNRYTDFDGIVRISDDSCISEICPYAPTQSLLQRWLREKHCIHIRIHRKIAPSNDIVYYAYKGKPKTDWAGLHSSYEEALEEELHSSLNQIEDNEQTRISSIDMPDKGSVVSPERSGKDTTRR